MTNGGVIPDGKSQPVPARVQDSEPMESPALAFPAMSPPAHLLAGPAPGPSGAGSLRRIELVWLQ